MGYPSTCSCLRDDWIALLLADSNEIRRFQSAYFGFQSRNPQISKSKSEFHYSEDFNKVFGFYDTC